MRLDFRNDVIARQISAGRRDLMLNFRQQGLLPVVCKSDLSQEAENRSQISAHGLVQAPASFVKIDRRFQSVLHALAVSERLQHIVERPSVRSREIDTQEGGDYVLVFVFKPAL